jgi:hypothetical protein
LLAGTYVLYEFVLSNAETKFLEAQTEYLRTQASILLMQEEAVRQASEQTSKAVADCVANMGQDHFIECLEYANKSTVDIQNAVGKTFEGVLKSNPIKPPTPSGISGVLSELKVPLLIGGGIFGLFVFWKIKQSKKEA